MDTNDVINGVEGFLKEVRSLKKFKVTACYGRRERFAEVEAHNPKEAALLAVRGGSLPLQFIEGEAIFWNTQFMKHYPEDEWPHLIDDPTDIMVGWGGLNDGGLLLLEVEFLPLSQEDINQIKNFADGGVISLTIDKARVKEDGTIEPLGDGTRCPSCGCLSPYHIGDRCQR